MTENLFWHRRDRLCRSALEKKVVKSAKKRKNFQNRLKGFNKLPLNRPGNPPLSLPKTTQDSAIYMYPTDSLAGAVRFHAPD